jgi:tetratricopeptide (TPR) repeat protein
MLRAAILTGFVVCVGVLPEGPAVSDQNDPRLADLFRRLSLAPGAPEVFAVEEEIWSIWIESHDDRVDTAMAKGISAMNAGDYAGALLSFDSIVQTAPSFAEGWNKRATLHFMMGALDASVEDIHRTLTLEPRHFGALSGLALIREAEGRPFEALEALEQIARLHPRLPHLAERVARLTRQLGDPI